MWKPKHYKPTDEIYHIGSYEIIIDVTRAGSVRVIILLDEHLDYTERARTRQAARAIAEIHCGADSAIAA